MRVGMPKGINFNSGLNISSAVVFSVFRRKVVVI